MSLVKLKLCCIDGHELAGLRCKQNKHHHLYQLSRINHLDLSLNCIMAEEEAPPEVHHYSSLQEVPWDIQK